MVSPRRSVTNLREVLERSMNRPQVGTVDSPERTRSFSFNSLGSLLNRCDKMDEQGLWQESHTLSRETACVLQAKFSRLSLADIYGPSSAYLHSTGSPTRPQHRPGTAVLLSEHSSFTSVLGVRLCAHVCVCVFVCPVAQD